MKSRLVRRLALTVFLAAVFVLTPGSYGMLRTANAADPIDVSIAYGVSADLSILNLLNVDIPPTPQVFGVGPAPYIVFDAVAHVPILPPLLSTAAVFALAGFDQPPDAPPGGTFAVAGTDGTALNLAELLTLNLGAAYSVAVVVGDCDVVLFPVAATSVANVQVGGLLGANILPPSTTSPAPNTELLNVLGIRVVLNEQTVLTDNKTFAYMIVNAVHIYVTNVNLGIGVGEVIIGHSEAARFCPSSQPAP